MVKYNYAKLLGKIRESGNTQESLAIKVKMSPSTLNLKLNNKRDFTQKQIKKICEELHIENVNEYFFLPKYFGKRKNRASRKSTTRKL